MLEPTNPDVKTLVAEAREHAKIWLGWRSADLICRLASALEASEGRGCPGGWRMVPCEPTAEMHTALNELGRITVSDEHERDQWNWYAVRAYRAMLQAAAEPPTP